MSNILHRSLRAAPRLAASASGIHITDARGKQYIDASSLRRQLIERLGAQAHVGDIRGRGLFMGVELVQDRARKTPFDPAHALHARVKARAIENGLLVYPMGGTVDGRSGDHVLLAPPFIVSEAQIDTIVELPALSIGEAIDSLAVA